MDNLIEKARAVAASALTDETRYDGSPFIGHPDSVARIVEDEIGLPDECVAAVYLHEATRIHKDIDISSFPQDVRTIVDGLNKISTIKPKDTRLEAENYKKLIVQYSRDPRVIVLKIADRLEVMRNLRMFPKSSRDQKLLETTMLYMPLAHQLGLYNINTELGNIYFRYSNPEQYRAITNKLKATEKDREQLTAEFIRPLERKLSEAGIKYKLKARTKSAFSIYRKMQVQKVPFEGVHDVFAIRFIIDCADDPRLEKDLCWKVYSYVTEEYEPDISRLRDWLTTPRPNGYESLHITVKNKLGQSLEVQIRTKRMDIEAESGNAAHWAYKGIRHEASIDRWLQSVRDSLEHPLEASPEHLPAPPDKEIFVFTPTGELRILAAGSSVLDFAFSIHTNLGSRCTGGKVNGKPVQIKEKLKTGDVVEIMTGKNQSHCGGRARRQRHQGIPAAEAGPEGGARRAETGRRLRGEEDLRRLGSLFRRHTRYQRQERQGTGLQALKMLQPRVRRRRVRLRDAHRRHQDPPHVLPERRQAHREVPLPHTEGRMAGQRLLRRLPVHPVRHRGHRPSGPVLDNGRDRPVQGVDAFLQRQGESPHRQL